MRSRACTQRTSKSVNTAGLGSHKAYLIVDVNTGDGLRMHCSQAGAGAGAGAGTRTRARARALLQRSAHVQAAQRAEVLQKGGKLPHLAPHSAQDIAALTSINTEKGQDQARASKEERKELTRRDGRIAMKPACRRLLLQWRYRCCRCYRTRRGLRREPTAALPRAAAAGNSPTPLPGLALGLALALGLGQTAGTGSAPRRDATDRQHRTLQKSSCDQTNKRSRRRHAPC